MKLHGFSILQKSNALNTKPDLPVHSVEVRQVPVSGVASVVSHASLGNWTTENRPMGLGTARVRLATARRCHVK